MRTTLIKPHPRGRPRKYGRPARAVTVTLPEDTISRLTTVHADIGAAIVTIVERRKLKRSPQRPAELVQWGNHAIILVTPIRALRRIRGVQLVPVGDGRVLISLEPGMTIDTLELRVRDVLDRRDGNARELAELGAIAAILRRARDTRGLTLESRSIIVLAQKKGPTRLSRPN